MTSPQRLSGALCFTVALVLIGCSGLPTGSGSSSAPVVIEGDTTATTREIIFLDSDTFDADLSSLLKQKPMEVDVLTPDHFGLNHIPQRLEKWLAEVHSSGGRVKAQPVEETQTASRSLLLMAFDMASKAYDLINDAVTYSVANQYDALVVYDKGSGMVKTISFVPRRAPAAVN